MGTDVLTECGTFEPIIVPQNDYLFVKWIYGAI